MAENARRGALLINLGTPDSPAPADVRRYLKEFLMDPWVIDIAYPLRWFLVNGVILRKRPADSAALYRKIWTDRGSPLLCHLQDLVFGVRARLGDGWVVEGAMRYGKPSIASACERLRAAGVDEVQVFPLYPQYSEAATRSSMEECERAASAAGLRVRYLPPFYADPRFVASFAEVARKVITEFAPDYTLFSFHGLPERQIRKTDRSPAGRAHCFQTSACCDRITDANRDCYRAQSFATAHAIARELGLEKGSYGVSFQSRLGRTPWIKPYTDEVLPSLVAEGKRKVAVLCPAFVADCLETLEEINIRAREDFRARGGEDLRLVPSLNSSPSWVATVSDMLRQAADA